MKREVIKGAIIEIQQKKTTVLSLVKNEFKKIFSRLQKEEVRQTSESGYQVLIVLTCRATEKENKGCHVGSMLRFNVIFFYLWSKVHTGGAPHRY